MNERDEIRLADAIEARASIDMYAAAPPAMGLRSEVVDDTTVLVAKSIPATYFNRAIGLGDGAAPARGETIDRLLSTFASAGVPRFWVHVTESAEPADLVEMLVARGFAPPTRASWAKFLRGPEAPVDVRTDLHVRVAGPEDAPALARVVCSAFGMPSALAPWIEALAVRPRWTFFLASDGNDPVGAGGLFVDGDTAWLGFGATLDRARGRGAQGAILAARIRAAAEAGCRVLATETGEPAASEHNPSLSNIRRHGFRQVSSRRNFASGDPKA